MNTQQIHLKAATDLANQTCRAVPEHLRVAQLSSTLTSLAYEILQRGGLVQVTDLEHFVIFAAEQSPEQPESWIKNLIMLRKKFTKHPRAELVDTTGILRELAQLQELRNNRVVSDESKAEAAPPLTAEPAVEPAEPAPAPAGTPSAPVPAGVTVPAIPEMSDAVTRLQHATKMAHAVGRALPDDKSVEGIAISLFYHEPTASISDAVKLFQAIPIADLKQLVQFRKKKYGIAPGAVARPESIRQEMLALQSRYLNNLHKSKKAEKLAPEAEAPVPGASIEAPADEARPNVAAPEAAPTPLLHDPQVIPPQPPAPPADNAFPIRVRNSVKTPSIRPPAPPPPTVLTPMSLKTASPVKPPVAATPPVRVDTPELQEDEIDLTFPPNEFSDGVDLTDLGHEAPDKEKP